jgi:hypothetical protein
LARELSDAEIGYVAGGDDMEEVGGATYCWGPNGTLSGGGSSPGSIETEDDRNRVADD